MSRISGPGRVGVGVGEESMDTVIPYERKKKCMEYKGETTKFSYEKEVISTKKTATKDKGVKVERVEEITEEKVRKVTLKTYGQGSEEDCEHFFCAFEQLQRELHEEWDAAISGKKKDARVLFHAFDQMLTGTASSEWHDILVGTNKRDFDTFKVLVARYITTKVLPEDAYTRQVTYMQERRKPYGMEVKEWWLRMQTIDRYLRYFFPNVESLQRWVPSAELKDLWMVGGLGEQEKKRIVMTKVPQKWQEKLREADVGHKYRDTLKTDDIVDYFTSTCEQVEKKMRVKQQPRQVQGRESPNLRRVSQYYPGRVRSVVQGPARSYQGPVRPYQGPARPHASGRVSPNSAYSNYNYYGSYQGGRIGYSTNAGGRTGGRISRPPQRFPQGHVKQIGGRYTPAQPAEAYYHAPIATQEQEEVEEEEEVEQELIEQWNENLFLEAPAEVDDEGYEYDEGQVEDLFYGDEDEYG